MTAVALEVITRWECRNCSRRAVTRGLIPNRFHDCPGLHGLVAPLIREGSDCRVIAVERGDYLRNEQQRTGDDGKPYMAVVTEYADGHTDAAVFPAVATLAASSI